MKLQGLLRRRLPLGLMAALGISGAAFAQEQAANAEAQDTEEAASTPAVQALDPSIEEVVVIARFYSAAQALLNERINDEVISDAMDAESISRLGDSTVAAALRRMAGLTLVSDKFIYVRGLGERYSSTSLNGATIPSPDLTRNVIPLDIFPASIVQSLRVQKSYSADTRANFGGGSIDIRTKGVPDGFIWAVEVGGGYNFENDGEVLSYPGGGDDDWGTDDGTRELKSSITDSISRFRASLGAQSILNTLREEGNTYEAPSAAFAAAQAVNREIALGLNRNIGIAEQDDAPDYSIKASLGNTFQIGQDWEFGFLVGGSYETDWRERHRLSRLFSDPEEETESEDESIRSVDLHANLNLGLVYGDDHEVSTTSLYLRNTDDRTAIRDFFNENRRRSDGFGFRDYRIKFEERDVTVNQVKGTHRLGDATRELLPGFLSHAIGWLPREMEVRWFYSDSQGGTSIPNQVSVNAQTDTDPETGQVLSSAVNTGSSVADFRFTELDDQVENYGWIGVLPFYRGNSFIEISVGGEHSQKIRTYRQTQLSLGPLGVADRAILRGGLEEAFSDANITNPANNYVFDLQGTNNQSYIAATMTDAGFGKVDWTLKDTWRLSAGLRWEDYRQVALDWNIYAYRVTSPQISNDPEVLEKSAYQDDQWFPSVSLTYMSDCLAETFQLRFGWSRSTVRPDLREITDASYIDPITSEIVDGNPGVIPSTVTSFDIRAEWFFLNDDNFTASLFYKDIEDPIEFFEAAASDTNIAREIVNAESSEVYGLEIEALKTLRFLGEWADPFFAQGNFTIQESRIVAGPNADAPTNAERPLTGASEYVANLMLGFDSYDGAHTASLIYNVFGERLYVAGRNGAPDGFEQPFHSIDFTYSWYPTDRLTVKAKLQNILNDEITIEREGIVIFEQSPGQAFSISVQRLVGARPSFEQERRSHVPTKAARPKGEGQDGPSLPRPYPATLRVAHHFPRSSLAHR